MEEIGQLRIFVSEKFFPIYHEISRKKIFSQNSEFFVFCSFVGEKINADSSLGKKQELCRAVTLSSNDRIALKALYYKHRKTVNTMKEIINEAEKFAESGLGYLIENELKDFVFKNEDGFFYIHEEKIDEIQIALIKYVLKDKQETPF